MGYLAFQADVRSEKSGTAAWWKGAPSWLSWTRFQPGLGPRGARADSSFSASFHEALWGSLQKPSSTKKQAAIPKSSPSYKQSSPNYKRLTFHVLVWGFGGVSGGPVADKLPTSVRLFSILQPFRLRIVIFELFWLLFSYLPWKDMCFHGGSISGTSGRTWRPSGEAELEADLGGLTQDQGHVVCRPNWKASGLQCGVALLLWV